MKRSQRIQSIVDIKAQQASKALAAIGEQQHKLQAAKQQLALLQKYRQDHMQENVGNSAKTRECVFSLSRIHHQIGSRHQLSRRDD